MKAKVLESLAWWFYRTGWFLISVFAVLIMIAVEILFAYNDSKQPSEFVYPLGIAQGTIEQQRDLVISWLMSGKVAINKSSQEFKARTMNFPVTFYFPVKGTVRELFVERLARDVNSQVYHAIERVPLGYNYDLVDFSILPEENKLVVTQDLKRRKIAIYLILAFVLDAALEFLVLVFLYSFARDLKKHYHWKDGEC